MGLLEMLLLARQAGDVEGAACIAVPFFFFVFAGSVQGVEYRSGGEGAVAPGSDGPEGAATPPRRRRPGRHRRRNLPHFPAFQRLKPAEFKFFSLGGAKAPPLRPPRFAALQLSGKAKRGVN